MLESIIIGRIYVMSNYMYDNKENMFLNNILKLVMMTVTSDSRRGGEIMVINYQVSGRLYIELLHSGIFVKIT